MGTKELVHQVYIRSSLDRVWGALHKPEHTRRYWGAELHSDWKVGSPITWFYAGYTLEESGSTVAAFDPPYRLSYTWHDTTPGYARALGMSEEMQRRLAAESRSTATFTLEQVGEQVKLVLQQDGFDEGSAKLASLVESWPRIISRMKTYLERDQSEAASHLIGAA